MVGPPVSEGHAFLPIASWDQPGDVAAMDQLAFRDLHRKLYSHRQRMEQIKGSYDIESSERDAYKRRVRAESMKQSRLRHEELAELELKQQNTRLVERLCLVIHQSEAKQKQLITPWGPSFSPATPGTLNHGFRRKRAHHIDEENRAMTERLVRVGPAVVTRGELTARYQKHTDLVTRNSRLRRPANSALSTLWSTAPPPPRQPALGRRPTPPWRKVRLLPPLLPANTASSNAPEAQEAQAKKRPAAKKPNPTPSEGEATAPEVEGRSPADAQLARRVAHRFVADVVHTVAGRLRSEAAVAAAESEAAAAEMEVSDADDADEADLSAYSAHDFEDDDDDEEEAHGLDAEVDDGVASEADAYSDGEFAAESDEEAAESAADSGSGHGHKGSKSFEQASRSASSEPASRSPSPFEPASPSQSRSPSPSRSQSSSRPASSQRKYAESEGEAEAVEHVLPSGPAEPVAWKTESMRCESASDKAPEAPLDRNLSTSPYSSPSKPASARSVIGLPSRGSATSCNGLSEVAGFPNVELRLECSEHSGLKLTF
ncbi:unnamed protein product [Polarella glacialis]|uniref:Uncharacterized protein n=1 Tax=Polarella glacialis TaxID=89957 RepID=A0A813JQ62_POLGL|nr:unnamed protein product [Polarella glacialis]